MLPAGLAIAPICGVLNWRRHFFVYGPARSGKTTIHTLAATLLLPLVSRRRMDKAPKLASAIRCAPIAYRRCWTSLSAIRTQRV